MLAAEIFSYKVQSFSNKHADLVEKHLSPEELNLLKNFNNKYSHY